MDPSVRSLFGGKQLDDFVARKVLSIQCSKCCKLSLGNGVDFYIAEARSGQSSI